MKKTRLQIVDFIVNSIILAIEIIACVKVHLGALEIFFFLPTIIIELVEIKILYNLGWIGHKYSSLDEYSDEDDEDSGDENEEYL